MHMLLGYRLTSCFRPTLLSRAKLTSILRNFHVLPATSWRNFVAPVAVSSIKLLPRYAFHPFRSLTSSGEVSTALQPFFSAVHPDSFDGNEKAVNASSLKMLQTYLESLLEPGNSGYLGDSFPPKTVTFYIRDMDPNAALDVEPRAVHVMLGHKDVQEAVADILQTFNLPSVSATDLPRTPPASPSAGLSDRPLPASTFQPAAISSQLEQIRSQYKPPTLESWLKAYGAEARNQLTALKKLKEGEEAQLCASLKERLGLSTITWECDWDRRYFQACLKSFLTLAENNSQDLEVIRGRKVTFGRVNGVDAVDGSVVLSSRDVQQEWLNLIVNIPKHDEMIDRIPDIEKTISILLNNMQLVHSKDKPVLAEKYELQLNSLRANLEEFRQTHSIIDSWPSMTSYQLLVESESYPLMLSPGGQIIVPASCPGSLLACFVTANMKKAKQRMERLPAEESKEEKLKDYCKEILGMASIERDVGVSLLHMGKCMRRILRHSQRLQPLLQGMHVRVSTCYSAPLEGIVSIPWNWASEGGK